MNLTTLMNKNKSAASRRVDARAALLAAAEQVFAAHGYEGARTRAIAEAAGVNLGLLQYYWGSKEGLFREVCEHRFRVVNDERLARLKSLQEMQGSRDEVVEALVRAMLEPLRDFYQRQGAGQEQILSALYARVMSDPAPETVSIMRDLFTELTLVFVGQLQAACDHLTEREFYWRLPSVLGPFTYAQSFSERAAFLSGGRMESFDLTEGTEFLVHSTLAVLLAPPVVVKS
ncbi:MAG: TetR/AcrR family transcriptional regulator [Spongiibacteraceae bacterium]|nr:TetR/AcrR family transcriptional regulator [Spongiibacteraceae bacterium]